MNPTQPQRILTAQDLLVGSNLIQEIVIPHQVLVPGAPDDEPESVCVRLRPLTLGTLTLISRAAREDVSLIPILMIKESLVEPVVTFDQVRQMHVGLVHFLMQKVNLVSGLAADGRSLADEAISTPNTAAYLLLAQHFGWTPEQVSQLTPGQVAVYLAGIEQLLKLQEQRP